MSSITPRRPWPRVLRDGRTAYIPRFTFATDSGDHEPRLRVVMDVAVDDWGRARCLELVVRPLDDEPVTGERLRAIPLARLLRHASAESRSFVAHEGGGTFAPPTPAERDAIYRGEGRRPRRGSPITDEHLEEVADVYRSALERQEPPTQAVMDEWHVSRSAASRWVAAARERGFLGPAQHGRATA